MSADMMLICPKRDENYENNTDKCMCIDETSMGTPHTDFGKMVAGQFAGLFSGITVDDDFIEKVKHWYSVLEHKDYVDLERLTTYLEEHKGESLAFECW